MMAGMADDVRILRPQFLEGFPLTFVVFRHDALSVATAAFPRFGLSDRFHFLFASVAHLEDRREPLGLPSNARPRIADLGDDLWRIGA